MSQSIVGPEQLQPIVDRLALCKPSAIKWKRVISNPVERLQVETLDAHLCRFSIEVSIQGSDSYGFYFGHGPHFDEVRSSEFDPLNLAEAVMAGSVKERLGKSLVVRSEGSLFLKDGRVLRDITTQLPFLSAFSHVADVAYRPYPRAV